MACLETIVNMSNDNSLARALEMVSGSRKLRMFVVQIPHWIDNEPSRIARIGASVVGPRRGWNCIDYKLHAIAILTGHRLAGLRLWRLLGGDAAECSVRFDEHRVRSKCLVCSGCYLWCSRKQFWPKGEQTSDMKRLVVAPSNVPFSTAFEISRCL